MPSASAQMKFDTKAMKDLAREMRLSNRKAYLKMNKALREGAQVVADDAKANASWSSRIPDTIKVKGGLARLSVVAASGADNEKLLPFAKAMEYGSKHQGGRWNRHPVFAARGSTAYNTTARWVNQPIRPFLTPAVVKNRELIIELVVDTVNRTLDEIAAAGRAL